MLEITEALTFLRGAIKESDLVPVLSALRVSNGRAHAYNGEIKISTPVPIEASGSPNAARFLKALHKIKDIHSVSVGEDFWQVNGDNASVKVPVIPCDSNFDSIAPAGRVYELTPQQGELFVEACRVLKPFVSRDPLGQAFARFVQIDAGVMRATNNLMILERWLDFPRDVRLSIPFATVEELCRIKEPPTHLQLSESTLTFHWRPKERFLLTHLAVTPWPNIAEVFEFEGDETAVDLKLWESVKELLPFTNDDSNNAVLWEEDTLTTSDKMAQARAPQNPGAPTMFSAKHFAKFAGLIQTTAMIKVGERLMITGPNFRAVLQPLRMP